MTTLTKISVRADRPRVEVVGRRWVAALGVGGTEPLPPAASWVPLHPSSPSLETPAERWPWPCDRPSMHGWRTEAFLCAGGSGWAVEGTPWGQGASGWALVKCRCVRWREECALSCDSILRAFWGRKWSL